MAGGIGSRFWPMSRTDFPKQFLDILNVGRTLIQSTYDRFVAFIPNDHIYIVLQINTNILLRSNCRNCPKRYIMRTFAEEYAPCMLISVKLHQLNPEPT